MDAGILSGMAVPPDPRSQKAPEEIYVFKYGIYLVDIDRALVKERKR